MRKVLAVAAVPVSALVLLGSGSSSNTATEVKDGDAAATSAAAPDAGGADKAANKTFKVGQVVKLGDWQLKVEKVTDPLKPQNEFLEPAKGKRWVRVLAKVDNKSSDPQTVSSLACFDVRDSESKKYTVTLTGDSDSQLDGEVAPGESLKGNVDFEVDKNAKGLVLYFKCDFLSDGSAKVALS